MLLPNPCGLGKNLCLISPTRNLKTETLNRDMFEKCKFLDEKLNDVDCSIERDTRDYVGEKQATLCGVFIVFCRERSRIWFFKMW